MSALAQPPIVRADTPKISKKFEGFAPKSADVRIWCTPRTGQSPTSWMRTSFMDRPLCWATK